MSERERFEEEMDGVFNFSRVTHRTGWTYMYGETRCAWEAWQARANIEAREVAELQAKVGRLEAQVNDALTALDQAEEINPSNYDHDLVCDMNSAYCEAYLILAAAAEPAEQSFAESLQTPCPICNTAKQQEAESGMEKSDE